MRDREIRVAGNLAGADKGKKKAGTDRCVYVQSQEAVSGENQSRAAIADSNAESAVRESESRQGGDAKAAATLILIEKLEEIVRFQV